MPVTNQVDSGKQQLQDREEMLSPRVVHVSTHHGGSDRSKSFDDCSRTMGLIQDHWSTHAAETQLLTSTSASRAGSARSRIGCKMMSGSMTLIDFIQLWMLDTVVLSCENIANKVTVLRLLTSSRRISFVRRRCCAANVRRPSI